MGDFGFTIARIDYAIQEMIRILVNVLYEVDFNPSPFPERTPFPERIPLSGPVVGVPLVTVSWKDVGKTLTAAG